MRPGSIGWLLIETFIRAAAIGCAAYFLTRYAYQRIDCMDNWEPPNPRQALEQQIRLQNDHIRKLSLRGCSPEVWRHAHLRLCDLEQKLADLARS